MSQFVETRVGDFLGEGATSTVTVVPSNPRPAPTPASPARPASIPAKPETRPAAAPVQPVPMTSAAARFAVEPPPPVIKRRDPSDEPAPKPAEKRPDQIFTF
jgi:S-DNA-T family DNA segregation ATPase FtsK/SpoIIIE